MNVIVIRTENENETEWGISFSNHNPEAKDYFRMFDEETAFRLKEYLAVSSPISNDSPIGWPCDKI